MACHICGMNLELVTNFGEFFQVTSDCKPWFSGGLIGLCEICATIQKPVTEKWKHDISKIYSQYSIYSQGNGFEQPIFNQDGGLSEARSTVISNWLTSNIKLKKKGHLLDFGCGTGVFLVQFQKSNPNWELSGFDHNSKYKTIIESLKNAKGFFSDAIEQVNHKFDIISLIHSLEHIPNPTETLKSLSSLLTDEGIIVIQVPNFELSPFDILIADHCSHFTLLTLKNCLNISGFDIIKYEIDLAPKEITIIAKHKKAIENDNQSENSYVYYRELIKKQLNWLNQIIEQGRNQGAPLGIFGTSISATWLHENLSDRVDFFVDEDLNRAGGYHLKKKIFGIGEIPKSSQILMPLRRDIAVNIKNRLKLDCLILPPE